MTDRSLSTQSVLVFVKNLPFPDFLKNPIAGSNTIFFSEMSDFLTIFKLSARSLFVEFIVFPDIILESYAHKIMKVEI